MQHAQLGHAITLATARLTTPARWSAGVTTPALIVVIAGGRARLVGC
jgi:hypothetical protein